MTNTVATPENTAPAAPPAIAPNILSHTRVRTQRATLAQSPTGKKSLIEHYCVHCGKTFSSSYQTACDHCNGMIDVRYDLSRARLYVSTNPYVRFADLLPIQDPARLLPSNVVYSPLIHAQSLGKLLGMPDLYLKNETVHPTGTTKDRMAAVALPYLWEQGVREFCTSSTGNSSSSYAYAITHHPDMRVHIFTAQDFADRVWYTDHEQVVHHVLRDASFVDAFNFAGVYAKQHGLISERGFFNVGRREGLKLAYFEACDQTPKPIDWYIQATSSAMGVFGTYKGAKELLGLKQIDRLPKLLCAQQESCAPMVRAAAENSEEIRPEHIVAMPQGIAQAILRGDPTRTYPYIRKIVLESKGAFAAVSEAQIREARRMVEECEGISPCFSAATALAALIKLVRTGNFPTKETVMVNLTGSDRPPAPLSARIRWYNRIGNEFVQAPAC